LFHTERSRGTPIFLDVNASTSVKAAIAVVIITATLAACKTAPTCPPGTRQLGEGPPNGSEIECVKTVNGQDVKEGPFVVYHDDGSKMIQGEYHDGKQTGEWTRWYDNGQMSSVDHYKDGVQDGEHTGWYTDGKIAAIGMYKDGKREGVWKRWDPQGFKNWEETYKDDKKVS
jgi:antitoxin component YwqK of YwqJK toxin-antitoxin module